MQESTESVDFLFLQSLMNFKNKSMAMTCWRDVMTWFWREDFWLPKGVTWADIDASLPAILLIPLVLGAVFVMLRRWVVEPMLLIPAAQSFAIQHRKPQMPKPNAVLEDIFKRHETSPPSKVLVAASKDSGMTERQAQRWLRRRYAATRLTRRDKFVDCGFKLVCHIAFGVFGGIVTLSKDWFWDTTQCWAGYPNHPIAVDVYWYYMVLLGYYWAITYEELPRPGGKGSDKAQMILHHTLTILLIVFSWTCGYARIGTLILFVHEYSDIALLGAKVCHYAGHDGIAKIFFGAFVVLWFVTRCGILPFHIVRSVFTEARPNGVEMPALYMMQSWFVGLLCLTVMWTGLVIKTIARKVTGGEIRDVRSGTECSSSSKED